MSEQEYEQAHDIVQELWVKLHDLVDAELSTVPDNVADLVRLHLTEQFRFWKRRS